MRTVSIGSGGLITNDDAFLAWCAEHGAGAVCELSMDDERITDEVDVEALIAAVEAPFNEPTMVMSREQLEALLDESLRQFLTPPRLPSADSCRPREDHGIEGDYRGVA
jgi:hypothetical protein